MINLKEIIQPRLVTAIHCNVEGLHEVQGALKQNFQNKFVHARFYQMDIINRENQSGIIEQTHNRAHRSYNENIKQIEKFYYWPEMRRRMKELIRNCMIYNKNKYYQHRKTIPIRKAPVPEKGELFI